MQNITGKAVTAADYLSTRLYLVEDLRKLLIHHSIIIEAPRRFGKTSIILEFARREQAGGELSEFNVIFMELEGIETLDQFCFKLFHELVKLYNIKRSLHLIQELLGKMWNSIAERLPKIELQDFALELRTMTRDTSFDAWKEKLTPLIMGLDRLDKQTVIAFDEFPDMLNNFSKGNEPLGFKGATDSLTAWLRTLRQESTNKRCFKFVFCGSVNLRYTLEEIGLGKRMNDLESLIVPPLSTDESRILIHDLASSYGLMIAPPAVDFMMGKITDGSPYYGQILVKALRDARVHEISLPLLQGIYEAMLRSGHHDIKHFHSRLDDYFPSPQERASIKTILTQLCVEEWHERDLFETFLANNLDFPTYLKLLGRLEYEGYIKRNIHYAGRLSYVSPVLKDWWSCMMGVR